MRRGEEWALQPRDRGPMKKLARDYVDAHRRPSEFYMYALIVLVVALVAGKSHKALNSDLQFLLLAIIAVIIVDAILLRRSISQAGEGAAARRVDPRHHVLRDHARPAAAALPQPGAEAQARRQVLIPDS